MISGRDRTGSLKLPGVGRLLHAYWRFSRGLTLGVRAVVLDGHGRVFLIRHTYASGWHFPGGGVEVGETALEAVGRELGEEARIEIKGQPSLHGVFFNDRVSHRDHVVVYVVTAFSVIEEKQADREIAEARFFSLDALPPDVTRATSDRLREIMTGAPVSPTW